jgi:hypothetical protein
MKIMEINKLCNIISLIIRKEICRNNILEENVYVKINYIILRTNYSNCFRDFI